MSFNYYEINAKFFAENTLNVDMTALYEPFLALLPLNAHILDAGCGSGRDSLAFLKKGYDVTSFDSSLELVNIASRLINQKVEQLNFESIDYNNNFDGIWACASLLHVDKKNLIFVFNKLSQALKQNGILYVSFKYGNQERITDDNRYFIDFDEDTFQELINKIPTLNIKKLWITNDKRPEKSQEKWLNAILSK